MPPTPATPAPKTWISLLISPLLLTFLSEIGDRTFILTALLSMSHNRWEVFWGSGGALVIMTAIGCAAGGLVGRLGEIFGGSSDGDGDLSSSFGNSRKWTQIICGFLFLYFSYKFGMESWEMRKQKWKLASSTTSNSAPEMTETNNSWSSEQNSPAFTGANHHHHHVRFDHSTRLNGDERESAQLSPLKSPLSISSSSNNNGVDLVMDREVRMVEQELAQMDIDSRNSNHPIKLHAYLQNYPLLNRYLTRALVDLIAMRDLIFSPVFLQTFSMTFLAEWGDRSQITTILLSAAAANPDEQASKTGSEELDAVNGSVSSAQNASALLKIILIFIGCSIAHLVCTGIAVTGGRLLARRISMWLVSAMGSFVFGMFGIAALIGGGTGVW